MPRKEKIDFELREFLEDTVVEPSLEAAMATFEAAAKGRLELLRKRLSREHGEVTSIERVADLRVTRAKVASGVERLGNCAKLNKTRSGSVISEPRISDKQSVDWEWTEAVRRAAMKAGLLATVGDGFDAPKGAVIIASERPVLSALASLTALAKPWAMEATEDLRELRRKAKKNSPNLDWSRNGAAQRAFGQSLAIFEEAVRECAKNVLLDQSRGKPRAGKKRKTKP